MRLNRSGVVLVALLAGASVAAAQDAAARADAANMLNKLTAIAGYAEQKSPGKSTPPRKTTLTDREVNAFFQVHGPDFLPQGVMDPTMAFDHGGRLRARATVDLDRALKPQERGWLDPLAWVSGKMEVTVAGTFQSADGRGQLQTEQVTVGGVTVPPAVLQELLSFYSRSKENPRGLRLDQSFELPSGIRSIEMVPGQVTIIQ